MTRCRSGLACLLGAAAIAAGLSLAMSRPASAEVILYNKYGPTAGQPAVLPPQAYEGPVLLPDTTTRVYIVRPAPQVYYAPPATVYTAPPVRVYTTPPATVYYTPAPNSTTTTITTVPSN
jgi:hypothetical protein